MDILWLLLIGLAAGFLAGAIMKGRGFGFVGNLIVGVLGALAGGLIFRLLGLATTNLLGQLISATVGAIVVLVAVNAINKRS